MSLHDEIATANGHFFSADAFAETVTYVPQGVDGDAFTIAAVVDWDNEEGNNQVRGDGRSDLNRDGGRSVRQSVIVELPTSRDDPNNPGTLIPMTVDENGKDRIKVTQHGSGNVVVLSVKRIVGRDEAAQSVLCTRTVRHQAQPIHSRSG